MLKERAEDDDDDDGFVHSLESPRRSRFGGDSAGSLMVVGMFSHITLFLCRSQGSPSLVLGSFVP